MQNMSAEDLNGKVAVMPEHLQKPKQSRLTKRVLRTPRKKLKAWLQKEKKS